MQDKCLIIYNPHSGKGLNKQVLIQYQEILATKGYQVDLVATQYSTHATETIINAADYKIVFSIGGDGTLNEVVKGNYLRDQKLTICPLPSGTCNDVATMLGYGRDPIKNLNLALGGEIHTIDIGTINDNPFVYVVGVGKFMNISYETSSEIKKRIGYGAYLKNGINELITQLQRYQAEISIDGLKLDGKYSLIMISNANHIAGINNFYKDVCLNDGEMEVLLCKAKTRKDLINHFLKFFTGLKTTEIISLKAHNISIKLLDKPSKNWCIDGERLTYEGDEYHIKISEKMPILTPKVKKKTLFNTEKYNKILI